MIKFKEENRKEAIIEALGLIARGEHNDLSANPSEWACIISYLALGGRIDNGKMLDSVDDLVKERMRDEF